MYLLEKIIQNKKELYSLAIEYFHKINPEEYEDIKFDKVLPKSISILVDHELISTPCVEIKLELLRQEKKTSNYFLYVDENEEFVDEFLY